MRKFILITAMVLASATAHAGGSRGLTLASNDGAATAEPSKPVEAKSVDIKPVETPAYVERPAAVDTKTEQPTAAEQPKPADKTAQAPRAEKPKHRHESTEARVIYELHRHGIYW
jgi:outer membrane biosynthesis protein TonB